MENKDTSGNSLYVGNLDGSRVTEQMMIDIFKNGLPHLRDKVLGAKMFHPQDGTDAYCFVTFADHDAAMAGMSFLNGREVFTKKVKVNWATSGSSNKGQTGQKYYGQCSSIFVGDLDQDIGEEAVKKAFEIFGEIVAVRVVRDAVTNQSKGYGFVSFKSKIDAEDAINKMQGTTLGAKAIRTNWATRNKVPGTGEQQQKPPALNYNEVYQAAGASNTTVYVANLPNSITDDKLRQTFSCFGQIQDTRIFMDKLYCFIKFATHESAATAIVKCNGMELDGSYIKCWWGKESGESSVPSASSNVAQGQQANSAGAYSMYNPYHQMYYNYWAAAMANQQIAGSGQSGQQQSNAQAYMPMMQGQGYPMYGMYSQQYGQVPMVPGYGGSGQQSSSQNGAPSSNYGAPSYQNSH